MIGKRKTADAAEQAREAVRAGHAVWAYMLAPATVKGNEPVSDWTETIEAIEAEGWRLDDFQMTTYVSSQVAAACLFRRG